MFFFVLLQFIVDLEDSLNASNTSDQLNMRRSYEIVVYCSLTLFWVNCVGLKIR